MSTSKASSDFAAAGKWLYLNADTADVQFIFKSPNGESEYIPAHKNLLGGASKVFRAMFYGQTKEKGDIPINDVPVDVFKEFLKFFYFDEVKVSDENVLDVVQLAHKYDIPNCFAACERIAKENLSVDNVCLVYGLAVFYEFKESKKLCEVIIGINAQEVLKTKGFFECNQNTLSSILKLNSMSCSEIELFYACMEWVKVASKEETLTKETIQKHLGAAFYEIRFGSMTMDELAAIFTKYPLTTVFTTDEHKDVVQMIVSKKHKSKMFNNACRQSYDAPGDVIKCSSSTEYSDSYEYDHEYNDIYEVCETETIKFSVNKLVLLEEITFAELSERYDKRICPLEEEMLCKLIIVEISEGKKRVVYEGDMDMLHHFVSLPKPVIIKNEMIYEIRVEGLDFGYDGDLCTEGKPYFCSTPTPRKGTIIQFHDGKLAIGGVRTIIKTLKFKNI